MSLFDDDMFNFLDDPHEYMYEVAKNCSLHTDTFLEKELVKK